MQCSSGAWLESDQTIYESSRSIPFKSFWDALIAERTHDRWSAVNAAVNAIYLALGEQRSLERISAFEGRAKASA